MVAVPIFLSLLEIGLQFGRQIGIWLDTGAGQRVDQAITHPKSDLGAGFDVGGAYISDGNKRPKFLREINRLMDAAISPASTMS